MSADPRRRGARNDRNQWKEDARALERAAALRIVDHVNAARKNGAVMDHDGRRIRTITVTGIDTERTAIRSVHRTRHLVSATSGARRRHLSTAGRLRADDRAAQKERAEDRGREAIQQHARTF